MSETLEPRPDDPAPGQSLRGFPRVDQLAAALDEYAPTHALRVEAARATLAEVRAEVRSGMTIPTLSALVLRAADWIARRRRPNLRQVINATGVIVHTNLGRAQLRAEAVAEVLGATTLEIDLATGGRGHRRGAVEPLLLELFEAPPGSSALVANNNAAAIMLALAGVLDDTRREVIVSRGELVEIGGSFRVPDVLAASGAVLREVGTTNRTSAEDFRRAVGDKTAALLRVHPSNYRISGFVARPSVADLVAVAREAGLPLLVDLGSDAPGELVPVLAADAERARDVLAAGADLVCFSGDKHLGGPQCGIVIGRQALVDKLARHPLMRALRPDKLALGALEHTLRAYALGEAGVRNPTYIMIHADPARLRARAEAMAGRIVGAAVVATADPIGGGTHPDATLAGWGVGIPSAPASLAADLRTRSDGPPIVGLTREGAFVLALRTVPEDLDADVALAVNRVLDTATRDR